MIDPATSVRTTTRVRFGETDQMGIVYHANYVVYFEIGRTEFMRQRSVAYAKMEQSGLSLAVVGMDARFRRSARYDQILTIETRLVEATHVQICFEYRIFGPDEEGAALLCEGSTRLACVDDQQRPIRIPSPWRELIDAAVCPPESGDGISGAR